MTSARYASVRSEKAEESLCDNLIARMCGRENVVRFSQARATRQSEGIPDRRYRAAGLAFWWEVKAENGRLRPAQISFLEAELARGCPVGVGTLEDLTAYLNRIHAMNVNREARTMAAIELGHVLIAKYTPRKRPKT